MKGYVYRNVKVRRLNSSAIEEMKLQELDGICGKAEQMQILFPLFVFSSWDTQWRGKEWVVERRKREKGARMR